ncbi:MAG: substrate-binding domain-containing protein [Candidatus Methylomirabilia bacterium]
MPRQTKLDGTTGPVKALWLSVLLLVSLPASPVRAESTVVILATTTSTQDSGLLDVLVPLFQKKTGYTVKPIAVGTGKALEMARRGDVDVILVHAPEAERPLVERGYVIHRRQFMHNDFVIVGPGADRARISDAGSAALVLKKVAEAKAAWVSRGDDSGTHKKEDALWAEAGITPDREWYLESGQGMGATLRIASEKGAYTLTDRATYLNLRKTLALEILFEGGADLVNRYSVYEVNPAKHSRIAVNHAGAKAFSDFLTSDEARAVIRDYGRERFGQPLFFLDPVKE